MSRAIILQHVAFETPGRIVPVFRDFGIPTEVRKLYAGDEVPTDLDDIRLLVVLGGPMGVSDVGNEKFPFLAKEVELLKRMVAADRAVVGICLGAQLLAHAGGAKVYPNVKGGKPGETGGEPAPELGWGGVNFPFPGGTEPIVLGMIDGAPMFHWHNDTFDLPKLASPAVAQPGPPPPTGNVLLATTRTCKNQAFRFKNRLFGFQFHFEFTPTEIEAVLANDSAAVQRVLGSEGEAKIREQTTKFYPRHERMGNKLLENIVQFLKAY